MKRIRVSVLGGEIRHTKMLFEHEDIEELIKSSTW